MTALFSSPLFVCALIAVPIAYILVAHLLPLFCKWKFTKTLLYMAVPMHLPLFLGLGLAGAELDVVLLVFLSLMLVYLLPRYFLYRRARQGSLTEAASADEGRGDA